MICDCYILKWTCTLSHFDLLYKFSSICIRLVWFPKLSLSFPFFFFCVCVFQLRRCFDEDFAADKLWILHYYLICREHIGELLRVEKINLKVHLLFKIYLKMSKNDFSDTLGPCCPIPPVGPASPLLPLKRMISMSYYTIF